MNIIWNKVTWYSKALAVALFFFFPCMAFYLGVQYGQALTDIPLLEFKHYAARVSDGRPIGAENGQQVPTSATAPQGMSYTKAVNIYGNRRIQFNDTCQANPASIVLKQGAGGIAVMLDNRSKTPRTISLDGVKYSVKGYGFAIATLKSPKLPHTVIVNCDSGSNNGQIILN